VVAEEAVAGVMVGCRRPESGLEEVTAGEVGLQLAPTMWFREGSG
jgi:hypothetical protein